MMQEGKSRIEKENDFIILMRNMFAGMDPDLVLVEKNLVLLDFIFPIQETKMVKQDDGSMVEQSTDEPAKLWATWGKDWNIYVPTERTPPIYERMMMTLLAIPSFKNRIQACLLMNEFMDEIKFKKTIDKYLGQADLYIKVYHTLTNSKHLIMILNAVLIMANYINHRIKLPGLSSSQLRALKDMLAMDELSNFSVDLTNYAASSEYYDNDRKASLPIFVAKWLKDEKIDLAELQSLQKDLKKVLKKSMYSTIADMDDLEKKYKDLMRLDGRLPPLDPSQSLAIEPVPPGAGFKDGFKPLITASLDKWEYILDDIAAKRDELFNAALQATVIFNRQDTTREKLIRTFGGDKPPCMQMLTSLANAIDHIIDACFAANKSAMFSMK